MGARSERSGWVGTTTTYQLSVVAQNGQLVPDPKSGKSFFGDGGPVFYQVGVRRAANSVGFGPELRSEVVKPGAPELRVLNSLTDGEVVPAYMKARGFAFKVAPSNQNHAAPGVRFKATFSGPQLPEQTRYTFAPLNRSLVRGNENFGANVAFLEVPYGAGRITRARFEAEHQGRVFKSAELVVLEDEAVWKQIDADREKAAVAADKIFGPSVPPAAEARVRKLEADVRRAKDDLLWAKLVRAEKLATARQQHHLPVTTKTQTAAIIDQRATKPVTTPTDRSSRATQLAKEYSELAAAAFRPGDLAAYRAAPEKQVIPMEKLLADTRGPNDSRYRVVAAYKQLVHGLVELPGKTDDARAFYARALQTE